MFKHELSLTNLHQNIESENVFKDGMVSFGDSSAFNYGNRDDPNREKLQNRNASCSTVWGRDVDTL
jgi:hypothetical protein